MNECSICLDKIDSSDNYYLECNHSYHIYCITEWFNSVSKKYTCPECRRTQHNININYNVIISPRNINNENEVNRYDNLYFSCFKLSLLLCSLLPTLICLILLLKKV